jgi:hypothetical protein
MGLQAHEPEQSKTDIIGVTVDLDHVNYSNFNKHTPPYGASAFCLDKA